MRTLFLLGAIIWALRAPLPHLLKYYLRTHLFVTAVLEGMLLFPQTDNYNPNHIYAAVYWPAILFVSVFMPGVLFYLKRARMFNCPLYRVMTCAWLLLAVYYVGYFRDPHSDRLDWVPTAIYGGAFICLGAVSRALASRRNPAQA